MFLRLQILNLIVVGISGGALLHGQVCRLSVAGLNQSRRVTGPVHAECPDEVVHTAPFGNWGVTSNYGNKGDSHQFDGWCHDTRTCTNLGTCQLSCTSGWYEWNSCTDDALFRPPNCSLYNAGNCTEQVSTTSINVHGTKYVEIPVRCPSTAAIAAGQGGCSDLRAYASGTNFMSLYELDPGTPDDLIQTLYFPETVVGLTCDAWGCAPGISPWVAPSAYDSPKSPAKVYAELATVVNWGAFVDADHICNVSNPTVTYVSAASYLGPVLAPGSIAAGFGASLAPLSASAEKEPLPTSLGGVSLVVTDSLRRTHTAPLFFVSPSQVIFLVPDSVAPGPSTIAVYRGAVPVLSGNAQILPVVPALFSANSDGRGVAAAVAVHAMPDGSQSWHYVFPLGCVPGSCVASPIDLGPESDQVFLQLYGTGIRSRSSLATVTVKIGGVDARVDYAGPVTGFAGLDQVNVLIPRTLVGRGEVDVVLTVDSKSANPVRVSIR